jgi:hypothetical protein
VTTTETPLDSPKLVARFWAKVEQPLGAGCWLWQAATQPNGYGVFTIKESNHLAHRIAWALVHGPILDGLTIDHLCKTRNCVRVSHMELATRGENAVRGGGMYVAAALRRSQTHCRNGHEYTPENIYVDPKRLGRRCCRACRRANSLAYVHRKARENV